MEPQMPFIVMLMQETMTKIIINNIKKIYKPLLIFHHGLVS